MKKISEITDTIGETINRNSSLGIQVALLASQAKFAATMATFLARELEIALTKLGSSNKEIVSLTINHAAECKDMIKID